MCVCVYKCSGAGGWQSGGVQKAFPPQMDWKKKPSLMDYFQLRIRVSHLVSLMAADCVSAATESLVCEDTSIHALQKASASTFHHFQLTEKPRKSPAGSMSISTHHRYLFPKKRLKSHLEKWRALLLHTHLWQSVIQHFNILEWLPTASLPWYWSFHWIPTDSHSNCFWRLRQMHMQSVWSHYNIPFS